MKKLIALAALATLATAANAADTGAYVFGNTGYNFAKIETTSTTIGNVKVGTADSKKAGGIWELGAGYRFSKNLAAELSYADFGKSKADVTVNGKKVGDVSMGLTAERVAVLGILPVADNVDVYGKLSLNNMHAKGKLNIDGFGSDSEKSNNVRAGVGFGASYQFNKNLAVRGEYEYIDAKHEVLDRKASGLNIAKVGVSYSF